MAETLVLDCSVAAKWVLPEPDRGAARRLFDRYASGEISLIAPDLLMAEFASLLAKRARRKQLSAQQAERAFELMLRIAPRLVETRSLVPAGLRLSLRYGVSVWDSIYLALAVQRNCSVVTADRRLFRLGAGRHPGIRLLE